MLLNGYMYENKTRLRTLEDASHRNQIPAPSFLCRQVVAFRISLAGFLASREAYSV